MADRGRRGDHMKHLDLMLGVAGLPGPELILLSQRADGRGFRAIWVPEITYGDAMNMDAVIAANTRRIKVGTGVVGIYSRSPVVMAMQAFSLNEFFPGRGLLGLGTQAPGYVKNWHGAAYEHFIPRMREYIHIVRRITAGERVTFEGKTLRIRNFQLMKPPLGEKIRIYIAAIAPGMIQLAGEIADGLFGYFYSTDYIRETVIPNLEIGAKRAKRSLDGFDIGSGYPTVVSPEGDAVELMKPHVMMYITGAATTHGYVEMARRAGFARDVEVIDAAIKRSDMRAAVAAVKPEMCRTFTICGTPAEAKALIEARYEAGLTSVMLNTIPPGIYYRLNEGHFPPDVRDQTIEMGRYVKYIEAVIDSLG